MESCAYRSPSGSTQRRRRSPSSSCEPATPATRNPFQRLASSTAVAASRVRAISSPTDDHPATTSISPLTRPCSPPVSPSTSAEPHRLTSPRCVTSTNDSATRPRTTDSSDYAVRSPTANYDASSAMVPNTSPCSPRSMAG